MSVKVIKRLDLLLREVTDLHAQENFFRIKQAFDNLKSKFIEGIDGSIIGQRLTWDGLKWDSNWNQITRIKSTQTIATTTPTTLDELTTVSLPVGWYKWKANILFQSTAVNTGVGFRVQGITSVLGVINSLWRIAIAADGTNKYYEYEQVSAATNLTSTDTLTANTDTTAQGEGVFQVSNAGTVTIQMRSETGTSVSARIGSIFSIERIS